MKTDFLDYLPITSNNNLEPFVDGKSYCESLLKEINKAKRHIYLTGLHFSHLFNLKRDSFNEVSLVQCLKNAADRNVKIYLLVNQFWPQENLYKDHNIKSVIKKTFITTPLVIMKDMTLHRLSPSLIELFRKTDHPIRKIIMDKGELHNYLPFTFAVFCLLYHKNIVCRTDIHPNSKIFATHHQKTVVVDDRIAYVGGIDLTDVDGDRWDTHEHKDEFRAVDKTNKYWHDVHLKLDGPSVDFVVENFHQRWNDGNLHELKNVNGKIIGVPTKNVHRLPAKKKFQDLRFYYSKSSKDQKGHVQIVRSMPLGYPMPIWNKHPKNRNWEDSCRSAYLTGIRRAKKYIYIENQWITDELIWNALQKAARDHPSIRIIAVLPYIPLEAAKLGRGQLLFEDKNMIRPIMEKIRDNNSFLFGMFSPIRNYSNDKPRDQIYVHSKILIVDDDWCLIGSANAGGISLTGARDLGLGHKNSVQMPDTEISAIIRDEEVVKNLRKTIWSDHLQTSAISLDYRKADADLFWKRAYENNNRMNFFEKFVPQRYFSADMIRNQFDRLQLPYKYWGGIIIR